MRRPLGPFLILCLAGAASALVGLAGLTRAAWIESLWTALGRRVDLDVPASGAAWLMQAAAPLWLRLAALAALMAFLLAIVWRRQRLAPLAAWTICAVAVVDPILVNHDLHPTLAAARLGPPDWIGHTRDHPLDRVYIGGRLRKGTSLVERLDAPTGFPAPLEWGLQEAMTAVTIQLAQTPAAWGIRELISYDLPQLWPREYTMMLRAFREAPQEDRLRFLRRTGTRYCFTQAPPFPGARRLVAPKLSEPMALYVCHDNPRWLYMTETRIVEPDLRRQLSLMFDERHDPVASVLLEREPPMPAGQGGAPVSTPTARVSRVRNTELVVSAAVGPSGGYLNVLDSYDPSWTVEVDGSPAQLLRANGLFRAVRLAPGEHEVRFAYRPTAVYAGLGITSATAAMLLLGCWAAARRPRRSPMPAATAASRPT